MVLTECAESLGSDPANGTLQSLEIGDVLFAAAHSFLYHYANSTSSSPRYDADRSQDQPPAVPAAQHSDSFPFTSARLTTDCQSNHPCSLSCRAHDKDSHFIVKQLSFNQNGNESKHRAGTACANHNSRNDSCIANRVDSLRNDSTDRCRRVAIRPCVSRPNRPNPYRRIFRSRIHPAVRQTGRRHAS